MFVVPEQERPDSEFLLEAGKENNSLSENCIIIKTIVTSEMGKGIGKSFGIETLNTLTGFKYIGEKIREFEETGDKVFLFG